MTAADSLGPMFRRFHGTSAELTPGDTIEPRVTERTRMLGDTGTEALAHVTSHPLVASLYGRNVYEVEPLGSERTHSTHTAPMGETVQHLSSSSGYRVIKKVNPNQALNETIF